MYTERCCPPVQPTATGTGAEALRDAARAEEAGKHYHDAVTVEGMWQAIEKIYARTLSRVPL